MTPKTTAWIRIKGVGGGGGGGKDKPVKNNFKKYIT